MILEIQGTEFEIDHPSDGSDSILTVTPKGNKLCTILASGPLEELLALVRESDFAVCAVCHVELPKSQFKNGVCSTCRFIHEEEEEHGHNQFKSA